MSSSSGNSRRIVVVRGVALNPGTPVEAIEAAQAIANDRAVAAGADRVTLHTIESEDMPLAYLPGNSVRVRVRVVGDVAATS